MADINYEVPLSEEQRIKQAADEAMRVLSGEEDRYHATRNFVGSLRKATLEAPLHSLAVAFLLGVLIARRR